MADIKENYIVYNVDYEDPLCNRCDNADLPEIFCINNCGSNHCWNGYIRTETNKNSNQLEIRRK